MYLHFVLFGDTDGALQSEPIADGVANCLSLKSVVHGLNTVMYFFLLQIAVKQLKGAVDSSIHKLSNFDRKRILSYLNYLTSLNCADNSAAFCLISVLVQN